MEDFNREQSVSNFDIAQAETCMTPVQRVMSRARHEIMTHKSDLVSVGVSEDLIEKATEVAGDRAKAEYEQKEKQDPIRKVVEIMRESAQTHDEIILAEATESKLEELRSKLLVSLSPIIAQAKRDGQDIEMLKILDRCYARGGGGWSTLNMPEDTYYNYPSSDHVSYIPTGRQDSNGKEILTKMNFKYLERILKGLGALNQEDVLSDGMSGSAGISGYFNALTDIDGIFIGAHTKEDDPWISFGFKQEAIKKIMELPPQ